jgi:hypothetical protein
VGVRDPKGSLYVVDAAGSDDGDRRTGTALPRLVAARDF